MYSGPNCALKVKYKFRNMKYIIFKNRERYKILGHLQLLRA